MKEFTQELNKLLDKYPDIGEFTITVRPRLIINTVDKSIPAAIAQAYAKPKEVPKAALEGVLAMEGSVNKTRLAELAKAAKIE